MTSPSSQREFALQVARQLRSAGYEAFWAGGCVRDQLLGLTPKDYDIATSARPEQVRELFGKRRTLAIGAAFGVIAVQSQRCDPIEVATFRSDGAYVDGRRPESVVYTTAEEDAQRRDFTINGMFFDPIEEQVIDFVGGEVDLKQGIVRAIGDPSSRFAEDKLRLLRAVRFATTFGFRIEERTLAAIRTMASEVTVISAERIGMELRRMLVHPARSAAVELLRETGLLDALLPELVALPKDPAWSGTLEYLERLKTDSLPVALALLLVQLNGPLQTREIGRRFRFTNKEIDRAAWLVEMLPSVRDACELMWPTLQRSLVHQGASDLLSLGEAVFGADHPGVVECYRRMALPTEQLNPEPLVGGDELVAHGLRPGPHFAELLDYLRDEQLEGRLSTASEAMAMADQWIREHQD